MADRTLASQTELNSNLNLATCQLWLNLWKLNLSLCAEETPTPIPKLMKTQCNQCVSVRVNMKGNCESTRKLAARHGALK